MTPLSRRVRHVLILMVTLIIPMAAWVGVAQQVFGHSCPDVARSNNDPDFPGGCIGWDNWVMCAKQPDEASCGALTMIYGHTGYWWTKPQVGSQVWEDMETYPGYCWGQCQCEWTGSQCLADPNTYDDEPPDAQRGQYNDTSC